MKQKELKYVFYIVIFAFMAYIFSFLFLRVVIYPDKPFDIDIAILSAFPTLTVAIATLLYVVITSKILQESQLERKKPFIEDLIKKMLFPLLKNLETKLKWFSPHLSFRIRDKKLNLDRLKLEDKMFDEHPEVFLKIFKKHYLELYKKIKIHDGKIPQFEKIYSDIINKIDNDQFRKKWERKINNYQKKGKDLFSELKPSPRAIDSILESIIWGQKSTIPDGFWLEYMEEILLEREINKKEFELLDKKTKEITDNLEDFKNDVIKKINSEQEKYLILAYKKRF